MYTGGFILYYLLLFALVIFVDQVSKFFAAQFLQNFEKWSFINDFLSLQYLENRGAAFGMLKGSKWLFLAITLCIIVFIIYMIFFKRIKNKFFLLAGVLICAGGVSNAIDRIFRGYVIDYIKFSIFPPVFNIADISVSFGVMLMLIYVFKIENKSEVNP